MSDLVTGSTALSIELAVARARSVEARNRIEALEAALRDARDRIPDWSTGSNAELLERIKVILADAVSPPIPVVQREQPIPDSEIVRELKQLHLSLMSSEDAHYRGDAFARAAVCIEALEVQKEVVSQSRIEEALKIWYPGLSAETMEQLKYNGMYELMGKVLAV